VARVRAATPSGTVRPHGGGVPEAVAARLTSQPRAWLRAERANLQSAVRLAGDIGRYELAAAIAARLARWDEAR
jgi:hypothetical protein